MINPVGIGVVGLGDFGQFVMAAFAETPEIRVVAVHDRDGERARRIAAHYGTSACDSYAALAAHPEVEVVYLATPPALHGPAALEALSNGKHLFVEKPLATSHDEMAAIKALAAEKGLRVGIDYVLRFNPIYRLALELGRSGVLGDLRHMTLENDASDDTLPPGHWFWDPALSGTILVEHGVHFFDMAAQLTGATGEHEYSQAWVRQPHGFVDRVLTVVRYGHVPATFYHAFDKPGPIERTEFRLSYDMGYINVQGWMPVALEVEVLLDEAGAARLEHLAARTEQGMGAGRTADLRIDLDVAKLDKEWLGRSGGRAPDRAVTQRVRLRVECPEGKQAIYARTIQAGVADFARGLREPGYQPEVTLDQAISSLRLALVATAGAELR
jgi:predicted dehydrogenase